MLYLVKSDFYIQIPESQFNKLIMDPSRVIQNNIWEDEVPRAIGLINNYLRSRYDIITLFAPFKAFDLTTTYSIGERIIWSEDDYDITKTYNTGNFAVYDDKIVKAKEDLITGVYDPAKWTIIIANESMYYCIVESLNNLPTDIAFWTQGDNRDQELLTKLIDICLYDIYTRLNNVDIPAIRKERFDGNDSRQIGGAIGWLKAIAKGHIQPNFPLNEVNQENQSGNVAMYGYGKDATDKNSSF